MKNYERVWCPSLISHLLRTNNKTCQKVIFFAISCWKLDKLLIAPSNFHSSILKTWKQKKSSSTSCGTWKRFEGFKKVLPFLSAYEWTFHLKNLLKLYKVTITKKKNCREQTRGNFFYITRQKFLLTHQSPIKGINI